jgi:2-hydroxychromene-2-carboxylate isomerase
VANLAMPPITVTHFSDPACPWAYSASPAHTALRFRYGDQLAWRHVMIGLQENGDAAIARGYTPDVLAVNYARYAPYGMPFTRAPRARPVGTWRACQAVIATRQLAPEHELAVFRSLQRTHFTEPAVLFDTVAGVTTAIAAAGVEIDTRTVLEASESPEVLEAFAQDRAEARAAAGSPTEFQDRAANSDGAVRYTAPSLIFEAGERRLEVGGFQPLEAYDVAIANLDTTLTRRPFPPKGGAAEVLAAFPAGVTTREVASA